MEENMNLKIKFYNNHFTKKIDNKKGMNIYNQNGQEYLIVERDYIYDLKLSDSLKDDYTSKVISDGSKTYRIIPITKKGNEYITCSFEKNINKYVENYCNYDYYL